MYWADIYNSDLHVDPLVSRCGFFWSHTFRTSATVHQDQYRHTSWIRNLRRSQLVSKHRFESKCSTKVSPLERESKTVLDFEFYATDSRFQVINFILSVELGFWIPIFSGIPDSLSCIPDSKAQDFRFHEQKFPCLRNSDSLTWGEKFTS